MSRHNSKAAWRSVTPLIRPYLGQVILLNMVTVLMAVTQVATAVITKFVIDAALTGNGQFLSWAITLCALLLGIVVLHLLSDWITGSTADRCMAQMRQAILAAASHSDGIRLQQFHSGTLLNRAMEDVRTVCSGFVSTLPTITGQITRLVGAFAAIILLYPRIAPLLLAASALIVAVTAALRPVMRRQHRQVRDIDEQVMAQLQENLQHLELVQSLQMEKQSLSRFSKWIRSSLAARRTRRIWSVSINTFLTLCSQLGTGVLLLWCTLQVGKTMTYGSLTAMLQLLSMLRSPVLGLSGIWTRISAIDVAAERLCQLLNQPEDTAEPVEISQVNAVVFQDVTFHYPGDETPVLSGFCARFPLARWACLTGISGRGKSTIFKLILGLYTPQEGCVYLETDKGNIPCGKATRHLFSYVPQDYSLFSGTIAENLLLAAPDADAARREAALQTAQAGFVHDLTEGEQTQVLENNTGLSKGQLQRVAIARAVLMDRPIFLLDECTSALDAQTENDLLAALHKLNKQAVVVTHRPDAVCAYEQVTAVTMDGTVPPIL